MRLDAPADVIALLREASRAPLLPPSARRGEIVLDRAAVEALIPHRDPFLFLDTVVYLSREMATIACRHTLVPDAPEFTGHFPGLPCWPGVLQVEAIGQAGLCLARLLAQERAIERAGRLMLTHVLGAEFVHPIEPPGDVEIIARVIPDGLFTILVGQCLQHGQVCSAAAVRGITEDTVP